MKNMMSIVFLLSSLLFSVNLAAAAGHSTGKITTLLWYEGHIGLLIKQEGMSDLGGCGRGDYYILDDQHPYFKEIYSLILSAHLASQPLEIHLNGCVQGISRIKHVSSYK
jgi:hypothetical protein